MALYEQHGTLDAVANVVGLDRASVHERLKKAGYQQKGNSPYSDQEREEIVRYYTDTPKENFSLIELSERLGRPKANISRFARQLGLTNVNRPAGDAARQNIKASSQGRWQRHPHPRGMAGKSQTESARKAASAASKKKWATDKAFGIGWMSEETRQKRSDAASKRASKQTAANTYSRCKQGAREDLGGMFFRSAWEANYARYLNNLVRLKVVEWWEYESETFWFEKIKRGVRSYKPDFKVKYRNDDQIIFVEVKGWMDDKSRTKLKRMRIYHPHIKIELVGAKEYRAIARKWGSSIPGWEGKS